MWIGKISNGSIPTRWWMMSNLVIVAISSEDDYTWRLSSEKIPHLTLLNLGEMTASTPVGRITDFLEHVASTSMHQFGLSVERRGELGENAADVLFFGGGHNIKFLEDVRSFLLGNKEIRQAYEAATQFPVFTPHLTLGFPETPAKPDKRDYPGISWVNFDRVALWTGDFEGPTFRLKDNHGWEMSMSDAVEDFLAHFGVKGMHWGTRKRTSSIPASDDHQRLASVKEKSKAGGTKALSNKDIQDYLNRLNLERQFNQTKPSGMAGKFISELLLGVGKQQATKATSDFAGKQVGNLLKGAAK